jgi:hypothetical protein
MQYMLLLHVDETDFARLSREDQSARIAAYEAFTADLVASGRFRGAGRLRPRSEARTVRITNGKPLVTDGPFAETKELIGGYFLVEAETMDEALDIAARCPAAGHGVVEVRPLWT